MGFFDTTTDGKEEEQGSLITLEGEIEWNMDESFDAIVKKVNSCSEDFVIFDGVAIRRNVIISIESK